MSVNRFVGVGRLTRDPELKHTSNGTAVASFNIAIDRQFKTANGEKETDFIPVIAWRGLAETCGRYLSKGKMVAVDGRLQIRTYEANDGGKRTVAEIVADNVQFLSPKSENGSMGAPATIPAELEEMPSFDDDIPF